MTVRGIAAISQSHVKVSIGFYNDEERQKLLAYPTGTSIQQLVTCGVEIPTAEFLTYYMFHRKRPKKYGYRDYYELRSQIDRALVDLEDWVIFNGESLNSAPDAEHLDRATIERVGESIGLSIVNRIHGLTGADWGRIPEMRGRGAPPVMDYGLEVSQVVASDGSSMVQVETKGSAVDNPQLLVPAVRTQKRKIVVKKQKIAEREGRADYPFAADLRYGTITALGSKQDSVVQCWIVDPQSGAGELDYYKVRLVNRLRFLADWLGFLSPQSQLTASLETRIADLSALKDVRELDGVPLRKGTGRVFDAGSFDPFSGRPKGFFASRSHVTDGPAGGNVIQLSGDFLYFIGVRAELVDLATRQSFSEIVEYKAPVGQLRKSIRCVFSKSRFQRLFLPQGLEESATKSGEYRSFILQGRLNYSEEGLVHGLLPTSEAS